MYCCQGFLGIAPVGEGFLTYSIPRQWEINVVNFRVPVSAGLVGAHGDWFSDAE